MQVVKCDACGKEIDTEKYRYNIVELYGWVGPHDRNYDLCPECTNKFYRFVKEQWLS